MSQFKGTFMNKLRDSIDQIQEIFLFLDKWDDLMGTLQQVWVVWEIFSTTDSDAKLEVISSDEELNKFLDDGLGTKEGFDSIQMSLAQIDAAKAQARNEKDRKLIFDEMENTEGVLNVNEKVIARMRLWPITTAHAHYDDKFENEDEHSSWLANNLAYMYNDEGLLPQAEELYRQGACSPRQKYLGEEHSNMIDSMSALGSILAMRNKSEEAESLLLRSLEARRSQFGNQDWCFVSVRLLPSCGSISSIQNSVPLSRRE